jgi:hypothetical protein
MPTSTLTQDPTRPGLALHRAAGAVVLGEVTCACGYRDRDNPADGPAAFLTRSLAHLGAHHPDDFGQLIGQEPSLDSAA